jgi:hypothetical protein
MTIQERHAEAVGGPPLGQAPRAERLGQEHPGGERPRQVVAQDERLAEEERPQVGQRRHQGEGRRDEKPGATLQEKPDKRFTPSRDLPSRSVPPRLNAKYADVVSVEEVVSCLERTPAAVEVAGR